jgi:hypothetical protein
MSDLDSNHGTVLPTDKEESDYRLDGRETSSVQTANTGEQAKEAATPVSDNRPEYDTPTTTAVSSSENDTKESEETTKIKAAIAAHNKMAISRGEDADVPAQEEGVPSHTKLSTKVSIALLKMMETD